jgi:hypothetical protein
MAIVKTTFTGQTLAAQKSELLAYLQENAADYFDTIEADSSGNISCYVGETVALLIGMDGTTTRQVTLANGQNIHTTSGETGGGNTMHAARFRYAKKTKKTANGILLATASGKVSGGDAGYTFLFITKNELGDTCILGTLAAGNYQTPCYYFGADIKNDAYIYNYISDVSWENRSQLSRSAPATSLTPAIFSGGHYAPKAYLATFNQYALTECDISINGKSYASDGVMVLED